MLVIFAPLAIPLRSYVEPFIVMAIIPFGVVGVVLGHLVLGVAVSVASLMGFFGLSGVVVNDSLVMIDFIDQRIRERAPLKTAIIDGAKQRFRPIFLTSVTQLPAERTRQAGPGKLAPAPHPSARKAQETPRTAAPTQELTMIRKIQKSGDFYFGTTGEIYFGIDRPRS